jgi:hypothetical protein
VRVLELPAPPLDAGRRPVLDAEQLRFEERFARFLSETLAREFRFFS